MLKPLEAVAGWSSIRSQMVSFACVLEREGVSVWVCLSLYVCVCVCVHLGDLFKGKKSRHQCLHTSEEQPTQVANGYAGSDTRGHPRAIHWHCTSMNQACHNLGHGQRQA